MKNYTIYAVPSLVVATKIVVIIYAAGVSGGVPDHLIWLALLAPVFESPHELRVQDLRDKQQLRYILAAPVVPQNPRLSHCMEKSRLCVNL